MDRTLRRGSTYKDDAGTVHVRLARDEKRDKELLKAGTVCSHVGGRMTPGRSPVFEISDEIFKRDRTLWEPRAEETAMAKADAYAKDLAWFASRGKEMTAEYREKMGYPAPANKEMLGAENRTEEKPRRERAIATKG